MNHYFKINDMKKLITLILLVCSMQTFGQGTLFIDSTAHWRHKTIDYFGVGKIVDTTTSMLKINTPTLNLKLAEITNNKGLSFFIDGKEVMIFKNDGSVWLKDICLIGRDLTEQEKDRLGFANYCLELHIIEPKLVDIERYEKQGGWQYYEGHIKELKPKGILEKLQ